MDLDGILSLLIFLEEKPSDDNCGVPDLVITVQTIIVKSDSLIQKIKKYLHKLKITSENMEIVSQVLAADYRHQLLAYQEKFNILNRSLIRNQTIEHYIGWFQYFLARNELWQDVDPDRRQKVFQDWLRNAVHTWKNFFYILRSIDRLIDLMQKSSTNDEFQILIISSLLRFSFTHGNYQFELR